jgi:hypothetical protein
MGYNICFNCGLEKHTPFDKCVNCTLTPFSKDERAVSLILSDYLSDKQQIKNLFSNSNNLIFTNISNSLISKAEAMLKDPQLMGMLDIWYKEDASNPSLSKGKLSLKMNTEIIETDYTNNNSVIVENRNLEHKGKLLLKTHIHQSPFNILGLSTRDNRHRIVEMAEEMSLELEHEICQKSRSDLTSPRLRLSTEIAWLPGISPQKAKQLLELVQNSPFSILEEAGLPVLVYLNLLSSAFEIVDVKTPEKDVIKFILKISELIDDLDYDDILRDINEDRSVSGFPQIKTTEQIEEELTEHKRYYRNTIKEGLNKLPSLTLVKIVTDVVDLVTDNGESQSSEFIGDLVDIYQVEAQGFLQQEAENIIKLVSQISGKATKNKSSVDIRIDKLMKMTTTWDLIAQPIQLVAKSRGIDHKESMDVAYAIRNLSIELFNKHNLLSHAQRLTELLQELFSELPELLETVDDDADALEEIESTREDNLRFEKQRKLEIEKAITYSVEIGMVFKDTLSINSKGINWKHTHYTLESISRVRWGGISHSTNGIPTGTIYTIAFGTPSNETVIEIKKEKTYSDFLDKLWNAVCVRMLNEMLVSLRDGKKIHFGNLEIRDDGVTITINSFFSSDKIIRLSWSETKIWSSGGQFVISSAKNKKELIALSYIDVSNTHILEQAIRMMFKSSKARMLSDLLKG